VRGVCMAVVGTYAGVKRHFFAGKVTRAELSSRAGQDWMKAGWCVSPTTGGSSALTRKRRLRRGADTCFTFIAGHTG